MKTIFHLTIFSMVILLVSCKGDMKPPENKTVFKYNESAGITSLDPAFAKDQANIWATNQIFNGLVQLDDDLKILPCIAKSWKISEDGLVYTFILRDDVFFHNNEGFKNGKGRRVKASDFVYSFNRIVDEKIASPGAWVFNNIRNDSSFFFKALNDSTLSIELKQTFPPFLGLLSMQYCSVVPKEVVEYYGKDFRKHPVGTGPFYFKMWKEGVKLVLLKNDNYFEFDADNQLPYLDAVSISFIIDKQSVFLEFVKGNIDFLSGIDASYKDELLTNIGELNPKHKDKFQLITQPYLNTEYLGFLMDTTNSELRKNPLKKKKIRQAINYGFDRKKMMRYLRNNIGTPANNGFIPKGMPSFNEELVKGYSYNPDKARQLLAEAGYPNGEGLPEISIATNSSYLDLCNYIQSQLTEIGMKVKIDVNPPATLREMVAQSKLPFFRASWIADYPDAENYLSLFYSKNFCPAGPNYTHFSNAKFDELFEKSQFEVNDSIRYSYYQQMDKIIIEEAPVVVLYYDQVLRFAQKNIEGLGSNPMNLLSLKRVRKF
ncbi:MAG: ABC transporter substrate-binding protein [Saprospiraceae bacterium]|nr:ABC transporter substrate-binding protein [Saprospiraceae bacterium]